jgi:hypothetical protein
MIDTSIEITQVNRSVTGYREQAERLKMTGVFCCEHLAMVIRDELGVVSGPVRKELKDQSQ